ncbi:hypothetical protein TNCV_4757471 [Trichonephila clavipes]|nr:hypothetical protein TNCV_4757471 [Trichonephila clavipes]
MAPQLTGDLATVSRRRISRQTIDGHVSETGVYVQHPVCAIGTRSWKPVSVFWGIVSLDYIFTGDNIWPPTAQIVDEFHKEKISGID